MHYFNIDKQRLQYVVTLQTLFIVSTRYTLWKFLGCNNSASDTADIGALQHDNNVTITMATKDKDYFSNFVNYLHFKGIHYVKTIFNNKW